MKAHNPLRAETVTAAGAVAANRAVTFANLQASVAGEKVLGVAQYGAALGQDFAVTTHGEVVIETGAAITRGQGLVVDAQGRAAPAADLEVAAGAVAVTSTAANGAILTGGELPVHVFADALEDAAGASAFIRAIMRR
ncbi:MAG: capsid cement protein [Pseudomonadota bacterium]